MFVNKTKHISSFLFNVVVMVPLDTVEFFSVAQFIDWCIVTTPIRTVDQLDIARSVFLSTHFIEVCDDKRQWIKQITSQRTENFQCKQGILRITVFLQIWLHQKSTYMLLKKEPTPPDIVSIHIAYLLEFSSQCRFCKKAKELGVLSQSLLSRVIVNYLFSKLPPLSDIIY